jgi:hypothetical protein
VLQTIFKLHWFYGLHAGFIDSCTMAPCCYGLSCRYFGEKNFEFHIFDNQKVELHTALCPEMIEIRARTLVQLFRLEDGDGRVLRYVGSTKRCHHPTAEIEPLLRVRNENPSIFEPVKSRRSTQASGSGGMRGLSQYSTAIQMSALHATEWLSSYFGRSVAVEQPLASIR